MNFFRFHRLALLGVALSGFSTEHLHADAPVRVQGVAPLTRVMKAAAPALRAQGVELKIGEECSSGQAAAALGMGAIDLALLGRAMSVGESAAYPERQFQEFAIGSHAVAVLVSRTIWESGVRALTREQITRLYEGRIESWKELGGEDRKLKFFDSAQGRGVWEIFAAWLYGDLRKAPAVAWEVLAEGSEIQTAVQFQAGAAGVAALRWADRKDVFPLALIDDAGVVTAPTTANVASGKYPLARSAFVVVGEKPTGHKRKVLEFLRSEAGQALVAEQDLLPLGAVPAKP